MPFATTRPARTVGVTNAVFFARPSIEARVTHGERTASYGDIFDAVCDAWNGPMDKP
jgi:hypothetical protein